MNRAVPTVIFCLSLVVAAPPARPQNQPVLAKPIVELEKTRFATTERVFFWVGVSAPDDYRIPQSLWTTCKLTITRPDGSERIDAVGWPTDGMTDRGWKGGHGLGSEPPQVGRYVLVLEFAGQRTSPVSFTVEDVPFLNDILREFVFSSPLVLGSPGASATLTVRNGSPQTIRFPHRGVMFGYVSVALTKTTGDKWSSDFFVPEAMLLRAASIERSTFAEDKFSWNLVATVPTVTLAPGATYRLALPLNAALAERPNSSRPLPVGEYDVRVSTTLQLLIGDRDGPWAELAPVRLAVESLAHATTSPPYVRAK